MACARQMHGEDVSTMVLQLNASDDRGIEMVRSYVKGFASTAHLFKKGIKLVILDEADAMTPDAQAALRRIMEKYAATTRFCLICNYVGKIIPALQSRCTRFRFAQHRPDAVKAMLDKVVVAESLDVAPGGIDAIVRLTRGDMRRALNIFQMVACTGRLIREADIYKCTGDVAPQHVVEMMALMRTASFADAVARVQALVDANGYSLSDVVKEVAAAVTTEPGTCIVDTALCVAALADIQHRLSGSCSDRLQMAAIVAAVQTRAAQ